MAHGSEIDEIDEHRYFIFSTDHALVGGKREYDYKTSITDEVFDRIFDEAHDRFMGFGPGGNATLIVDESLKADVEGVLSKTMRLNVGGYEERVLCYASSRPGDDTVALFTLSKCPENCQRALEAYKNALQIYSLENFPKQYATTQNNLGNVYLTMGQSQDWQCNCMKAIRAAQEALRVFKLEDSPEGVVHAALGFG